MRSGLPSRSLACIALALLSGRASAQESLVSAVEEGRKGVVHLSVLFRPPGSAGVEAVRVERPSSGILLRPSGLVLTNLHLVAELRQGEASGYWAVVELPGRGPLPARLRAIEERLGLALLELGGTAEGGIALPALGESDPGRLGVALGLPRGGSLFAHSGAIGRPVGPVRVGEGLVAPQEAWVCNGPILAEADGGPMVDALGQLLGIVNTAHLRSPEPGGDEEDAKEDLGPGYALVISAPAIQAAFRAELGAAAGEARGAASPTRASAAVASLAPAVVSLWSGPPEDRPEHPSPDDPLAQEPIAGLGSGVIVDPVGLLFASLHQVSGVRSAEVRLADGRRFPAELLAERTREGIGLWKLALPESVRLPAVPVGSSQAALAGEGVVVLGNPYGHTPVVGVGVLSSLEAEERLRVGTRVHPGHRGGALVDLAGSLLGIALTDIHEGAEKKRPESYLGLAVPIDRLREWFQEELEAQSTEPALRAVPTVDEAALAGRRTAVTAVVERTRDALLNIEVKAEAPKAAGFDPFGTRGDFTPLGQGSGVVIDPSGLALSNWHVVDAALQRDGAPREDRLVEASLPSGRRYLVQVLSTSRDDDLALVQLRLPEGERVDAVELGASRPLALGEPVVAIGNPFGKANTVTAGIVAAKDQDVNIAGRLYRYHGMLQTDAAINPGNSGGALLDLEGRLVGINSAGRSGVGLAIPVERAREVFRDKLLSSQARRGAHLGLSVREGSQGGVVVAEVERYGPADRAGFEPGDLLLALADQPVEDVLAYGRALLGAAPWLPLRVEVERHGERLRLEPVPVSDASWAIFRQTGVELAPVDYREESALVQEASVALHRTYTGVADASPRSLMGGALRVVQARSREAVDIDLWPGDLLLGATVVVQDFNGEHQQLLRFESLEQALQHLASVATPQGASARCWRWRGGEVAEIELLVKRVR